MQDDQRRAAGLARRLIFQNLANGVPAEQLGADLQLSQLEIEQARRFVSRKIIEHNALRRQPPVACEDMRDIRWNRRALLAILARIGDIDLSTDLILAKVTIQSLDHPEMIEGAQHRMKEAYQ